MSINSIKPNSIDFMSFPQVSRLGRLILFFAFAMVSCATPPTQVSDKPEKTEMSAEKQKLPAEEQTKKAFEIFNKILDLTSGPEGREAILPGMEAMYEEIINEYPDAPLVEESYWKLITIEVEEFKPPRIDKAERLYGDFQKKYPGSLFHFYLERTFGQYFSSNMMWDRILKVFAPRVKSFIQTGKLESPYAMFMYSDAKYNLKDYAEAEKGYRIVIEFFPKTAEGEISRNRLEEIKKKTGGS